MRVSFVSLTVAASVASLLTATSAPSQAASVGGVRRPLAGSWRFKVATIAVVPDGQQINKIPAILYNRMIHPLLGFPIKGVLWYQGESNANNVKQASDYPCAVRVVDHQLAQ